MKKVQLGKTGLSVSGFCLGCMMMGTAMDKRASFEVLDHFLESGGNFIDTANCYAWWMGSGEFIGDESENIIGQWMKERKYRNDVVLATKVGGRLRDPHHIRGADGVPEWHRVRQEYEGLSAPVIRSAVEDSLRRLQTDSIDLYYTHVYDEATPLEETLSAMDALVREGKVRHIGCSNITTEEICRAGRISAENGLAPYAVMQQEYSYLHPDPKKDAGIIIHGDEEMFSCAREKGMAFLAYSPLLKGIYAGRHKRENYYNWHLFDNEKNLAKLELVQELAVESGITGNQLVLAWLKTRDPEVIPILGFSRKEQYMEDIAAAEIVLPEEHLAHLNALDKES